MKHYSNFQLTNVRRASSIDLTLYGTIDITTKRFIFFGKEKTITIELYNSGLFWKYLNDGIYVNSDIERAIDVAEAKYHKPFNKVTKYDFKDNN